MRVGVKGRWRCAGQVLAAAFLLLALVQPVLAQRSTAGWSGTVTHVTDGDTVWVRPQQGGTPRVVRIDGVDAPELCQPYGDTARAALVAQVLGQTVQVRVRRHDDYGRALARLSLRGQDIGGWLVSRGHAWSYRYRREQGPYARQEARARAQRLGLFQVAQAEQPREFRRRHGPCH
jgi:endonuclease YncB( thermonuclease family)